MQKQTQRSRQAEEVKTAILDAAIPLFAHGYDSTSLQQIAAAAGVKQPLLLYHFGSKEKLWEQTAARLMQRFEAVYRSHLAPLRKDAGDRLKLRRLLLAFVLALRELPAYGQFLLCEGVQVSGRLSWLHRHYFPAAFLETQFGDARLHAALMQVSLARSALAGALLYTVVAGPQIAQSARLEGSGSPDDLYPISDAMAARLVEMMCDFVFSQLQEAPPARARARSQRR